MFVKQETDACLYLAHSDDGQTKMETNMDYNYLHETKTNIETKPTIKDEPDELMDSTNDAQSPLLDPGPSSSCLYDDHQVKEEMVLGPTVLYKPILNSAADMPQKPTKKLRDCLIFEDGDKGISCLSVNVENKLLTKPAYFDDVDKENNALIINAEKKPFKKPAIFDDVAKANSFSFVNAENKPHTESARKNKISEIPLACAFCHKIYKYKKSIQKHLKGHVKSPGYCKLCNNICQNKSDHFKSRRQTEKIEKCNICYKTFTYKANLVKHFKEFHDSENNTFMCDFCNKIFRRKDAIATHIRAVHCDKKLELACKCGKSFFDKKTSEKHKKFCRYSKTKEIFNCEICYKTLPNFQLLKRHINYHERKIREKEYERNVGGTVKKNKFYCDFCSKCCDKKERLVGHINKNHMAVPLLHTCAICDKSFALKKTFDKHFTSHTGRVVEFSCKYCNTTYRSKWGFQRHETNCLVKMNNLRFRRNSNNTYTCTYKNCNRECPRQRTLVRHWNKYHRKDSH